MSSRKGSSPHTVGSSQFEPDVFFEEWEYHSNSLLLQNDDLRSSIIAAFNLNKSDSYIYHAIASVSLSQMQDAISHSGKNSLHAWYVDEFGKPTDLPPPSSADISAYTSIFASTTSTPKALTSLVANAKKGSHRATIAQYLQSKRLLPASYTIPKLKKVHVNPYYDYWAWSCHNLEWAGPTAETVSVKQSHHILPVLMHHFGCVAPSYESLEVIKKITRGRKIIEIGSGNGYWTYMLRRMGVHVDAIDNFQSIYRTLWIGDTIVEDGAKYLRGLKGTDEVVLLMVYPIVGSELTASILDAFNGDTICVAGTQNQNGYTAFKDQVIDEYVASEKPLYKKIVQIPLPSFAGKDEALFIFDKHNGSMSH